MKNVYHQEFGNEPGREGENADLELMNKQTRKARARSETPHLANHASNISLQRDAHRRLRVIANALQKNGAE